MRRDREVPGNCVFLANFNEHDVYCIKKIIIKKIDSKNMYFLLFSTCFVWMRIYFLRLK